MKGCKLEDKSTSARKTYRPGKKKKKIKCGEYAWSFDNPLLFSPAVRNLLPISTNNYAVKKKKWGKNYTSLTFLKT